MPQVHPIAQEDVGRFSATVRPQTDDTLECCPVQKVRPGLPFKVDAVDSQLLNEFSPRQRPLICKHIADNTDASCASVLVQAQFGTPTVAARNKHRAEERQEPAQILCRQQMQRTSLPPGANDSPLLHSRTLDIGS